jgi:hypothetical protein
MAQVAFTLKKRVTILRTCATKQSVIQPPMPVLLPKLSPNAQTTKVNVTLALLVKKALEPALLVLLARSVVSIQIFVSFLPPPQPQLRHPLLLQPQLPELPQPLHQLLLQHQPQSVLVSLIPVPTEVVPKDQVLVTPQFPSTVSLLLKPLVTNV